MNAPVGAAEIAVSDAGTDRLLTPPQDADYRPATNYMAARIDWMNRDGEWTPLRTKPTRWLNPRFAPDGRRLAFTVFDGTQHDVWIVRLVARRAIAPDVRPGRRQQSGMDA